jgi:hypothetical protein
MAGSFAGHFFCGTLSFTACFYRTLTSLPVGK